MTKADRPAPALSALAIAALFVTALVTSQLTAVKVIAIPLPVTLPVAGASLIAPAAVFAYAVTFFASDCYAELYGRRAAHELVNVSFAMNFVLLALVWLAIASPTFAGSPVAAETFASALGPSTGIVIGSLIAYLISQNWDVFVFHRLRDVTDGEALWLRNVASTASSQLIDTVVFILIAFVGFQGLPLDDAGMLIVGQYVLKLGIVALDTPFVYLVVGAVRRRGVDPQPAA
ncbi:MAG: queuosine precursor transporter [Salinirussus sp.]